MMMFVCFTQNHDNIYNDSSYNRCKKDISASHSGDLIVHHYPSTKVPSLKYPLEKLENLSFSVIFQ